MLGGRWGLVRRLIQQHFLLCMAACCLATAGATRSPAASLKILLAIFFLQFH